MSRSIHCDRCKKEITKEISWVTVDVEFIDHTSDKLDLCRKCWNEIADFINKGA